MTAGACIFCRIVAGEVEAYRVFEDENVLVFLDTSPMFAGHCLVCPKRHFDTLMDLTPELLSPLMEATQLVGRALEHGLGAGGSLVAVNNRISQSVPHLHIHVIPRKRGDGLKGFFWPRRPYRDRMEATQTQEAIASAITYLRSHDL